MSAKLKKDYTYKKSSSNGIQGAGGSRKPKTTEKNMTKSLKNTNKPGKKV